MYDLTISVTIVTDALKYSNMYACLIVYVCIYVQQAVIYIITCITII